MKRLSPGWMVALALVCGCGGTGGTTGFQQPVSSGFAGTPTGKDGAPVNLPLKAVRSTEPILGEAGDVALWVHASEADKNLILMVDRSDKSGALLAFDQTGKQVQRIDGLKQPSGVDVRQGATVDGKLMDIVAVVEQGTRTVKMFSIDSNGKLSSMGGQSESAPAEKAADVDAHISLYERKADKALFAFVTPSRGKDGGSTAQFKLTKNDGGGLDAKLVRVAGTAADKAKTLGVAADADTGILYLAEDSAGIRKLTADADAKAGAETLFAKTGYAGPRTGMKVAKIGGTPYLLSLEKMKSGSRIHVFKLGGKEPKTEGVVTTPSEEATGMDVYAKNFGKEFPEGILVISNTGSKSVDLYDLREFKRALQASK